MGFITCFLLSLNICLLIAVDIYFWVVSWQSGLSGLIGILAFFIAYSLSVELSLAPRDFWWNSEFDIFIKKLGFAWSAAGVVFILFYMIFGMTCGFE